MAEGSCVGHPTPDLWFPTNRSHLEDTLKAKAICKQCPVQEQCLDYGVATHQKGIWGGKVLPLRKRRKHD